jgi:dTDP-4-dehydrorhamnose reductase
MKKVFITGINGLLGANLALEYKIQNSFYVSGCDLFDLCAVPEIDYYKFDLLDFSNYSEFFQKIKPDVIIHCAANVDVDNCEIDKEFAYKLNVETTKTLAEVSGELNSKLIFISSDAVFDGKKELYNEDDKTNPVNYYGETKVLAENEVKKISRDFLIIRTNIYGWNGQDKNSIGEWMYYNFKNNTRLKLFADVYFTPILVNNLSDIIKDLIDNNVSGLFHVAGKTKLSKYDFGILLADVFNLDRALINKSSVDNFPFKAKRSNNMALDVSYAESKLKSSELLNARSGLELFKYKLETGYVKQIKGKLQRS